MHPTSSGGGGGGPLVIKQSKNTSGSTNEPSGEAESLWGRINPKEMGTRYKPLSAPIGVSSSSSTKATKAPFRDSDTKELPKSAQLIYEALLSLIRDLLGDQPGLTATTKELIELFHSTEQAIPDKKIIEDFLGLSVIPDVYSQISLLIGKIPKTKSLKRTEDTAEGEAVPVLFEASSSEEEQDLLADEEEEELEPIKVEEATVDDANLVDIDMLAFTEGGHLMSNRKCILPDGSLRFQKDGYEEVQVPAPAVNITEGETLIQINELPEFYQPAFAGKGQLNRIQSKVAPSAIDTDNNLLVCAPTGAGKTNIALLGILKSLLTFGPNSKAIYVAPMKALVTEMVSTFSRALSPYNVQVAELTGDTTLTRAQLAESFVLVCTPEKLDIITRKIIDPINDWFFSSIRLVVLDEIHLLHDLRGPVLECLIARFINAPKCRLLGLSATLPNYQDVARTLHVPDNGIFYFDSSYRPCPLAMQYCALSERRPIQRMRLLDKILLEKVSERPNQSILIFVHSRKEAARTARYLAENLSASSSNSLRDFQREQLRDETAHAMSIDLRDLLPLGFGIHHAGLSRNDRTLVETLFAQGRFPVLVSTATLAWGVNLPARTVIIKGTQVYSPEKGAWVELSPQDTLQMLGRAGRPQFDVYGEGIILTASLELQYYLSLTNLQLPIESQLISRFVDCLNAEVVNGTIRNKESAKIWFDRTYLCVRMQFDPLLYGNQRGNLPWKLIHSAFSLLDKEGLLIYDARNGAVEPSSLGRIASFFYLTWRTVGKYASSLKPWMSDIDLLRTFSMADEFRHLLVRSEEKVEIAKLLERVPIPIKEAADDPLAKINALLQCYISRVSVEGLALLSDLTFISGSAARLFRALNEMAVARGWAKCAHLTLDFCRMVEQRQWRVETPLRQFSIDNSADWLRKLERKDFPFERLFDLDENDLTALLKQPAGELIKVLKIFPQVKVEVRAKPRRSDLLQLSIKINSLTEASADLFNQWQVFVEDVNRTNILNHCLIRVLGSGRTTSLQLNIPLTPNIPVLFVVVTSDRYVGTDKVQPVNLLKLSVPPPEEPPMPIVDTKPIFVHKILPQVEDKTKLLSVSLTQTLPSFHRQFVFSAGPEYDLARQIILAPGYSTSNLIFFDHFNYRAEVDLIKLLVSSEEGRSQKRIGILIPAASNVQQMAEWIQADVGINYQPDLLPIESDVLEHTIDFLNEFISFGAIKSKRDALTLLSRTFLYRRLLVNPFYYGCPSGMDLSEFLSAQVEDAVEQLEEGGLIEHDSEADILHSTAMGHIAARYAPMGISVATVEMFALSVTPTANVRNILDLVSAADEFISFEMDTHEVQELYRNVEFRIPSVRFSDPHHQIHIALQSHMTGAISLDQSVLSLTLSLSQCLSDVAASQEFVKPVEECAKFMRKILRVVEVEG